jgi:hypothetical protein
MSTISDPELEWEAEGEYEGEGFGDQEFEDEQFLGGLIGGIGKALGLGEGEYEDEYEGEGFGDQEFEDEQFLGGLVGGIGKALGLGEGEYEDEYEYEYEGDGFGDQEYEGDGFGDQEYEDEGEPFLPALLPIAKMALPLIGGLFRKRRRRSRESEFEGDGFGDGEFEDEQFLGSLVGGIGKALGLGEGEYEDEAFFEVAQNAGANPPAMAEVLATMAAKTPSESEAEALIGAATIMTLTARERRTLERLIPQLLRAMAILTRLLRRRPNTRRVVRVIPSVIKATTVPVVGAAVRGHPPTTSVVGRVLTRQTRTVLTKPAVTKAALRRNATVVRRAAPRVATRRVTPIRRRVQI